MSSGDDQRFGGSAPPPRSIFDEPTVQVSLSHEPDLAGPLPGTGSGVFDRDPYGYGAPPGPGRPSRGRILSDESTVGGAGALFPPSDDYRPAVWAGDRAAPPFAAPGARAAADGGSVMERVVEGAYRWRSLLGLGLAGLMTVAIVVAYRGASNDEGDDVALNQFSTPTGQAFGGDATVSTEVDNTDTVVPSTQVGSQVDEVTSTLVPAGPSQTRAPATTIRSTTTATTRPSVTSSTVGGTSASSTSTSTVASSSSSTSAGSSSTTGGSTTTAPVTTTIPSTSTSGSSTTLAGSTTTSSSTSSTVQPKLRLEAEGGTLVGQAKVLADHEGYSGTGFVGDLVVEGRGVTFTVDNAVGGATPFRIRYAAGNPAIDGSNRQLSVRVNGETTTQLVLRETTSWTDWTDLSGPIPLQAGANTITLIVGPADSGIVNVDYIELY